MLRTLLCLCVILLMLSTETAHAQYGPVDTTQASQRILHNALNDPSIGPVMARSLDEWNFEEWDQVNQKLMTFPQPAMRMAAAISIAKVQPTEFASALNSLEDASQRSMILTEVISSGLLTPEQSRTIARSVELGPVIEAMLFSATRTESNPQDLLRLEEITNDSSVPIFARGVAAAERAERGDETSSNAWLREINDLTDSEQAMLFFELAEISNTLSNSTTITALVDATSEFKSDDLTRATVILAALTHTPEVGLPVLETMLMQTDDPNLRIALSGLAIETGARPSDRSLAKLKDGVPLHEKIHAFLSSPADQRLEAATPLLKHGHLQTIRWVTDTAKDDDSAASAEAITVILKSSSKPSSDHLELIITASEILAQKKPELLTEIIVETDSKLLKEIHLTSLAKAGTKAAAEAALPLTTGQPRAIRSMAMLAVARGTELDDLQVEKLGKIAAGGGSLPSTLRAPAAWIFLEKSNAIGSSLPAIIKN